MFFGTGIAHSVAVLALVIFLGVALGKFKVGGISLGVTMALFVGIVASHFGMRIEHNVLNFAKEFGLILFVFAIGLQVGPSFFSSFKEGGLKMNAVAVFLVAMGVVTCIALKFITGLPIETMVGIMSGAVLSWITCINELSSSIMLYSGKTSTIAVAIYQEVVRMSDGTAAALATILTLTTIVSLVIVFRATKGKVKIV